VRRVLAGLAEAIVRELLQIAARHLALIYHARVGHRSPEAHPGTPASVSTKIRPFFGDPHPMIL
jgi:hypothetical protein